MSKENIETIAKNAVIDEISKLKSLYWKIIGTLGVVVLLQAGSMVWQLATNTQINKNQQILINKNSEAVEKLAETVAEYVKSQNVTNNTHEVKFEKLNTEFNEHKKHPASD